MAATLLLALVLLPVLMAAFLVNDWSRDLTTNTASTEPGHKNLLLRPFTVQCDAQRVAQAVTEFAESAKNWELVDLEPLRPGSPLPQEIEGEPYFPHHLVRTTPLLRFKDDVWLVVEPAGEHRVRIHAESRSRLGFGDLGQNPRNLEEMMSALRRDLGDATKQ